MKLKCVFILTVLVLLLPYMIFAQQTQEQMDPAMKAYMEAAAPGAPHKALQNLVGTWDATVKSYMNPANPTESKATSTLLL